MELELFRRPLRSLGLPFAHLGHLCLPFYYIFYKWFPGFKSWLEENKYFLDER